MKPHRDRDDLIRAARSVAEHFKSDRVIAIGSQAILLAWPDAPANLRRTPEIDLYPANRRQWELDHPGFEASEEISALFGEMSAFHDSFGFYLDGVDEHTARMPADWQDRAIAAEIDVYGRTATLVCPAIEDIAASKLHRLAEKDIDFLRDCTAAGKLDPAALRQRFRASRPDPAVLARGLAFLTGLHRKRP